MNEDATKGTDIPVHPVQISRYRIGRAVLPQAVTMRAYEVYCHLYGPQDALVTGGCHGGLSAGDLIAFLYARSFPKDEWIHRVDEALKGAQNL
jgi:hypothetical protein